MISEASTPIRYDLDATPPQVETLFEAGSDESVFLTLDWFRALAGHGFAAGHRPLVYTDDPTAPRAGLVMSAAMNGGRPRLLGSCANFYSCRFGPVFSPSSSAISALVAGIVAERPAWDVIDLNSLDRDAPEYAALLTAFRDQGWRTHPYFHFGNWYEDVAGMDRAAYLAGRPGNVRSTLKRRQAKLAREHKAEFRVVTGGAGLEAAIADYERVYAESWKGSEPFADFAAALARTLAARGALRLGVLLLDDRPVAAQIWTVWRGRSTIFKLAQDQKFDALSVGTLLTMHVMQHVLEQDRVAEVDFGRGDDPYKALWLPKRRERWGIMAFNPRTLHGNLAALRHIGGGAAGRLVKRLRRR